MVVLPPGMIAGEATDLPLIRRGEAALNAAFVLADRNQSGLLIMAILRGARISPAQGWIADQIGIHHAFILPAICYLYIVYYALRKSKPVATALA